MTCSALLEVVAWSKAYILICCPWPTQDGWVRYGGGYPISFIVATAAFELPTYSIEHFLLRQKNKYGLIDATSKGLFYRAVSVRAQSARRNAVERVLHLKRLDCQGTLNSKAIDPKPVTHARYQPETKLSHRDSIITLPPPFKPQRTLPCPRRSTINHSPAPSTSFVQQHLSLPIRYQHQDSPSLPPAQRPSCACAS